MTKVEQPRNLAGNIGHHLLDQETAEADAGKAALTVGDRVEHRRGGALRVERLALDRQNRRDRPGNFAGQGDLDEDQRFIHQGRMKERIAAPIARIDAGAQIDPVADLVHRLVADDLFQDDGGRRPVDAAQHQEAAIEPGCKQRGEIRIDSGEVAAARQHIKELPPHFHQGAGPLRRQIEPPQQFLPPGLGGSMEVGGGRIGWLGPPRFDRFVDPLLVAAEPRRQGFEKCNPRPGGQFRIAAEDFPRQCDTGSFTPVRQQLFTEIGKVLAAFGAVVAPVADDQRASPLGNRLQ